MRPRTSFCHLLAGLSSTRGDNANPVKVLTKICIVTAVVKAMFLSLWVVFCRRSVVKGAASVKIAVPPACGARTAGLAYQYHVSPRGLLHWNMEFATLRLAQKLLYYFTNELHRAKIFIGEAESHLPLWRASALRCPGGTRNDQRCAARSMNSLR